MFAGDTLIGVDYMFRIYFKLTMVSNIRNRQPVVVQNEFSESHSNDFIFSQSGPQFNKSKGRPVSEEFSDR